MKSIPRPMSLTRSGLEDYEQRHEFSKHTGDLAHPIGSLGNLSGQSSRPCVRISKDLDRLPAPCGDLDATHVRTLGVSGGTMTTVSPANGGRGGTVISKEKIGFSSYKGTETINSQGFNNTMENFTPKRNFGSLNSKRKTHQPMPKMEEIEEFPHRGAIEAKQNRKPYETTYGVETVRPPSDAFKYLVDK